MSTTQFITVAALRESWPFLTIWPWKALFASVCVCVWEWQWMFGGGELLHPTTLQLWCWPSSNHSSNSSNVAALLSVCLSVCHHEHKPPWILVLCLAAGSVYLRLIRSNSNLQHCWNGEVAGEMHPTWSQHCDETRDSFAETLLKSVIQCAQ